VAAEAFGVDISKVKKESAGEVLSEALAEFLIKLGDQPRGLKHLGFGSEHIESLVEGTMPQKRVLMLAPEFEKSDPEVERDQLRMLFENAMEY
jgi:hydroxyacid-oxoacid transhydrogenase